MRAGHPVHGWGGHEVVPTISSQICSSEERNVSISSGIRGSRASEKNPLGASLLRSSGRLSGLPSMAWGSPTMSMCSPARVPLPVCGSGRSVSAWAGGREQHRVISRSRAASAWRGFEGSVSCYAAALQDTVDGEAAELDRESTRLADFSALITQLWFRRNTRHKPTRERTKQGPDRTSS